MKNVSNMSKLYATNAIAEGTNIVKTSYRIRF